MTRLRAVLARRRRRRIRAATVRHASQDHLGGSVGCGRDCPTWQRLYGDYLRAV